MPPSKDEVESKRAAQIEKKEAERKAKNAEIGDAKKQKQAEREKAKEGGQSKAAAAAKQKAEIEEKRNKNVEGIETVRKANSGGKKGSTKYSRKDVMQLKAIFGAPHAIFTSVCARSLAVRLTATW